MIGVDNPLRTEWRLVQWQAEQCSAQRPVRASAQIDMWDFIEVSDEHDIANRLFGSNHPAIIVVIALADCQVESAICSTNGR